MTPEDAPRMVGEAMEAGNLDKLAELYEPNASLVVEPGTTVTGSAAIREAMASLIGEALKHLASVTLRPGRSSR